MHFERIYDDGLAAASYIVGCQAAGAAWVVDPLRDVDRFLDRLDELDLELAGVFETHIHADFVSGGRDLARATDTPLYISGEQGEGWKYGGLDGIDVRELSDRETVELGSVRIEALHTPGHTPEHLSYLVTDGARGDEPVILLSGDFLFVGDLGRPDLLEKAAGEVGTAQTAAEQLFESVRDVLCELPDDIQVWPGHGAGSACGKSIGAVPSSTVGYERQTSWWADYISSDDRDGFVEELLEGQPASPSYFARMKEVNRDGLETPATFPSLPRMTPAASRRALSEGALLLDLRDKEAFADRHAVGAFNLASMTSLSDHAGWAVPYDRDLVVLCDESDADEALRRLYRVGFDRVIGRIPELSGHVDETESTLVLEPETAAEQLREGAIPLDVRSASEFEDGHIDGAIHRHFGRLGDDLDPLARDASYVVYCGSGVRASLAVSLLRRLGYDKVANGGGYEDLRAVID